MSWPKPKTPIKDRQSRAPYNFVPLPEKVVPAVDLLPQDQYYEDRYTGQLDCGLTTRSPVYVRCGLTSSEHQNGKETKEQTDFFFTNPDTREPVVPGSSLRGLVRTIVEIVSYGKVQPVTDQNLVYRAVGDTTSFGIRYRDRLMRLDSEGYEGGKRYYAYTPLMKAGYIRKTGFDWEIQPAQSIGGTTFARIWQKSVPSKLSSWHGCRNARELWIRPGPYEYKDVRRGFIKTKFSNVERASARQESGLIRGIWARSGRMFSKRFDMVVFPADEDADPISIPDEMVRAYQEQISPEQARLLGKNGVLCDQQPVFYLIEDGQLVFFGHTMMMRLPYLQSPNDHIPPDLRSQEAVDLAEAIFGYVDLDVEESARAGRVFVGDASLAQDPGDVYLCDDAFAPKILSSPKPTTFQHYLVQQTPDAQPDGRNKDGTPRTKVVLSHYASPTPEETVIRGHKLYWHKGDTGRKEIEEEASFDPERDTQHTWLKPLRSGVRFGFRIHFENLSKIELGALLWALTLPGPGTYCHKLGMGKPLGMGAVEIESELRLTERKARYGALFDGDKWQLGEGILDAAQVQRQSLEAFEEAILSHKEINPGKRIQSLAELPRIQHLLALLSWPGPDPRATEYVTELREFTQRKVLPTPLTVAKQAPAPPVVSEPPTKQPPTSPAPRPPVKKPPTQPSYKPKPKPKPQAPAPVRKPAPPPDAGRHAGLVTYYNFVEGRGTVLLDGSDEEVEVRSGQLRANLRYLAKDQRVTFAIVKDNKGIHLEDVGPE